MWLGALFERQCPGCQCGGKGGLMRNLRACRREVAQLHLKAGASGMRGEGTASNRPPSKPHTLPCAVTRKFMLLISPWLHER